VPFTASQLGEVPARDAAAEMRVFDVELPYRRLGRCACPTRSPSRSAPGSTRSPPR
jgi:hypothetical protein